MKKFKHIFIIAVFIFIASTSLQAEVIDDESEAVSLYAKGKRMMREGNYYDASKIFMELAGRFSSSKNIDLFLFNRGKAELYLDEYSKAIASFTYYIQKFETPQTPFAFYFRGNAYYLKGDVVQAIRDYIQAYSLSNDSRLTQQAITSLETAFRNASSINFNIGEFSDIPDAKRCPIVKILADIQIERGELTRAKKLLESCGQTLDPASISNKLPNSSKNQFEVAMVLPFSGELNSFAQDIYNGAVIAAEMFRDETGKEIKLSPYDTKGDPIDAARIITEISGSFTADAAIGPLTSNEAAVASASLSCSSLPLIIPAATQAGLTHLSNTSFQLSPNIDMEGIRMAEYAVRNLKADSAVIITSTLADHLRMARAFSDRFEQLGGKVVVIEYYRSSDNDFGKIINDIKFLLLGYNINNNKYINPDGDTLIPEEIEAHVDCIFLPGSAKQLRQLAQQMHFYSLTGAYLGSDGWSDESVMRLGDAVTKGVIFTSPFLSSGSTDEYFKFTAQYDSRFGNKPARLSNLGFDALRLICQAITNGNYSKESISDYLKTITKYYGASGKISFGNHRENMEMPLYQVKMEQAIPLDKPAGKSTGSNENNPD